MLLRKIDQVASHLIDLLQRLGHCWVIFIGAKALHVVIEMRQIDHGERGIKVFDGQLGGLGNPAGGRDIGVGSPKIEQRKFAQAAAEFFTPIGGDREAVWQFATVGFVDGARCRAEVVV